MLNIGFYQAYFNNHVFLCAPKFILLMLLFFNSASNFQSVFKTNENDFIENMI